MSHTGFSYTLWVCGTTSLSPIKQCSRRHFASILPPFLLSRTTQDELLTKDAALRCFKHFHLRFSPRKWPRLRHQSVSTPFKWLHPQSAVIWTFYFCLQPYKPCRWVAGFFLKYLTGARGKVKPRSCFAHFFMELRKKFPPAELNRVCDRGEASAALEVGAHEVILAKGRRS